MCIFNLGMPEYDSFYVYMPMQEAQAYFKLFEDELKPGAADARPDGDRRRDRCRL